MTAITLLSSSVFASTITLDWTNDLTADWKSKQTVNWFYDSNLWIITGSIVNKVQKGGDNPFFNCHNILKLLTPTLIIGLKKVVITILVQK